MYGCVAISARNETEQLSANMCCLNEGADVTATSLTLGPFLALRYVVEETFGYAVRGPFCVQSPKLPSETRRQGSYACTRRSQV